MENDTAGSNGALRGWKWHLYEGGIRVPFIVRWPAALPAGRTDTTSVLNMCDLTPTFLHLAGATMPTGYQSDGANVIDALLGRPYIRPRPMFWHHPSAARRGPVLAVRDGKWKLLMEPDGTETELFDLEADPSERRNVAEEYPATVHKFRAQLRTWLASLPKPLDRVHERPGPHEHPAYTPSKP